MQMMQSPTLLALLLPTLLAAQTRIHRPDSSAIPATHPYTDFGFRLLDAVARDRPQENVFLSPASAAFALGMVVSGMGDSAAGSAMRILGAADTSLAAFREHNRNWLGALTGRTGVALSIANALWAQSGVPLRPEYVAATRRAFDAEVATLDLTRPEAVGRINAWVSEHTNGKIAKLLDGPPSDPALVVTNAVYFKGKWSAPFDPARTTQRPFHTENAGSHPQAMMSRTGTYQYVRDGEFQILRLPYAGERMSLLVILPNRATTLVTIGHELSADRLAHWRSTARPERVHVVLPKFRIELTTDLIPPLTSLGLGAVFDPRRADLSGMLPRAFLSSHNAYVSQAVQKTFLDVSEEGTEAAAATGMTVTVTSALIEPPPVEFIVDHPFVVALQDDETGLLLFLGQIADPAARS